MDNLNVQTSNRFVQSKFPKYFIFKSTLAVLKSASTILDYHVQITAVDAVSVIIHWMPHSVNAVTLLIYQKIAETLPQAVI